MLRRPDSYGSKKKKAEGRQSIEEHIDSTFKRFIIKTVTDKEREGEGAPGEVGYRRPAVCWAFNCLGI